MVTFSVVSHRKSKVHTLPVRLTENQHKFFQQHPEINKSEAARQGLDRYIKWYREQEKETKE